MSTVPLPEPAHPTHAAGPLWSEQQMLAYGEACAAATREEALAFQAEQAAAIRKHIAEIERLRSVIARCASIVRVFEIVESLLLEAAMEKP